MTTVSKNAAPVKTHRSKAKAEATRRGLLYALPDWLMIIMLFFVPIVLLVIMAGSRWSLMGGNRGWNFLRISSMFQKINCSDSRCCSHLNTP